MSNIARYLLGLGLMLYVFALAFFMQSNLSVNWDVSWDLLVTRRVMLGGTYTKDFFDLNPPLIFYEYMPVIFLEHVLAISEAIALQLYVFFLSCVSLFLCTVLMQGIFLKKDIWIKYGFFFSILFIFLILPGNDFGQREHLLLIFTLPYFLTVVSRLRGNGISGRLAVATGLFAAAGFCIKPYFLIPFILVELYYLFFTRRLLSWLRPEVAAIIVFFIPYIISVFIFYPDYLFTVIPIAKRFYYDGFSDSWATVFFSPVILFCYFSIIIYLFQYKNTEYSALKSVMAVSMTGFLLAHILQRTSWTYHIYPSYAMALLMSMFFLVIFIKKGKNIFLLSSYFAVLLIFTIFQIDSLYQTGVNYKKNNVPLIAFLKEYGEHHSVYFIGASSREIFPAINDANVQYASRFLHLFWMPGIVKNQIKYLNSPFYQNYKRDENFLTKMLAEDINTKKPDYILVDNKDLKPFYALIHFKYLPYLGQNADFKAAFKPYHYFTTIEKYMNSTDQKKWDLYFFPNKNAIHLYTRHGCAVVLTGTGNVKRVYVLIHNKWASKNNKIFYTDMLLTPEALKLVAGQFGLIRRDIGNAPVLDQIITRSIFYPLYKFDVYRRDAKTTERVVYV